MTGVTLTPEHRSALIHTLDDAVHVTAPNMPDARIMTPGNEHWAYVAYDSEAGIWHCTDSDPWRIPREVGMSERGKALLQHAQRAIEASAMPVALFLWEYRDLEDEQVRKLVPVDYYLPLPPGQGDDAPLATVQEARDARLRGWNLRCNRCGGWGATWHPGLRPEWGAAALCGPHARELSQELARHQAALAQLRRVSFEQVPGAFEEHVGRERAGARGGERQKG